MYDQHQRKENQECIQIFADWLWDNKADFGERIYTSFDEYADIDESTKEYNYEAEK